MESEPATDIPSAPTLTFRNAPQRYATGLLQPMYSNSPMPPCAETRVLVADDSPIYRHLITTNLREWGFEAIVVNSGSEAWEKLKRQGGPTLAVLDWMMPGMDGVELCRKLRAQGSSENYVYTILLTAKDSHADLLKAMEAGVDDFLAKPFDELELKARLLVGKRIVGLHQELIAAREAMRAAATFDALTGLLNRREIVNYLRRELARASRERRPVSVVMADLDHFKRVNDQHGHLTGDEVLREVARRLQSGVRAYDGVGRYGGEEFLIVLPGCNLVNAFSRADQIRMLVANKPIATASGATSMALSMGLAVSHGDRELETLLHQADLGLYRAKRNGRNRVEQVDEVEMADHAPPSRDRP